jgi:hypothetical protein
MQFTDRFSSDLAWTLSNKSRVEWLPVFLPVDGEPQRFVGTIHLQKSLICAGGRIPLAEIVGGYG